MSKILLAAGAAAMALSAGSSLAASKHKSDKSAHAVVSGPAQPIPYAQLDAYLKASPQERASRDWSGSATAATTGSTANASATAPSAGAAPDNSSAPSAASPDQGKGEPSAAPPATKTPPDAASPK